MTRITEEFDEITIEPHIREEWEDPGEPEKWNVYGHGEYEESSVLAGQYRRAFIDQYEDLKAAVADFPGASVVEHSTKVDTPVMPHCPPDWFDPMAAGEAWSEDDY